MNADEIATYREMVARCCGDAAGTKFCESFGCEQVTRLLDAIERVRGELEDCIRSHQKVNADFEQASDLIEEIEKRCHSWLNT